MRDEAIRIPAQLGAMLRARRTALDLTQAQVAAQMGVSAQALSKLEQNASRVSFERIHHLCRVLGLELHLRVAAPVSSPKDGW